MTIWDWIFLFYLNAVFILGILVWYGWSQPKEFAKELVCDGCGQVCSTLDDGLCVYCKKQFKPLPKRSF